MSLSEKFPPLYECSVCEKPVKVTSNGVGVEPTYEYHKDCDHRGVTIYAKRKVTLVGVGRMNMVQEASYKFKISVRQFLSMLTGRSI